VPLSSDDQERLPRSISARWPLLVRLFHWTSALLLLTTWALIWLHENTSDDTDQLLDWHKACGVLFLVWIIGRIVSRVSTRKSAPPAATGPVWQQRLAHSTHGLLYLLMLAMPITGILMVQLGGHPVNILGWFDLPMVIDADRHLKKIVHELHTELVWTSLWVLTLLHIVAALYHQLIMKDKLINRMK
jgi:cytochrome b561